MKRTSEKLPEWAKGALWTIGIMNLVVFVFIVLPSHTLRSEQRDLGVKFQEVNK